MITNTAAAPILEHQELFKHFAEALQDYLQVRPTLDEARVRAIVDAAIAEARLSLPLEIHVTNDPADKTKERPHCQFSDLMALVAEGHRNILMVGPAGFGKTTLARDIAKSMHLEFGFISLSAGVTETHLFGRTLPQADGTWAYAPSRFVEIYENGGVFLLDEMDAADANVMVAINAALANRVLANPVTGKLHYRAENCFLLAAANTWGRGEDKQYVGRNQLDAATLDRFVLSTIHVGYDAALEQDLVQSIVTPDQAREITTWVAGLRAKIAETGLRRIASTRLIVHAANAFKQGRGLADVKRRYLLDWSPEELAKIVGI